MREESLIPREIENESVLPDEILCIPGEAKGERSARYVELLKAALPTAKTDEEMIAMEVRAAFECGGAEVSEEVAHIVTDALLASDEMREHALLVAHRILKERAQ